ncbi:hypothetical protein MKW92_023157 [Papaver armeniacum]|nr:hypothetical protein MKW92_023157 [Papaver armeniacum]
MTLTITSVYQSKPLSSISVLFAIPRIFKRLAITFFHALPLIFLIYTAYLAVFALMALIVSGIYTVARTDHYVLESLLIVAIIFLTIGYFLVLCARAHTIASWNFANVVSILEPNTYGSTAIKKSKELLQEKVIFKIILLLLHLVTDVFVGIVNLVMLSDMNIRVRVLIISLCAIALAAGNFLGLTAHNLMYYVCTGYDSQVIGKTVSDDCVLERQEFGKDNRVEGDKLEV